MSPRGPHVKTAAGALFWRLSAYRQIPAFGRIRQQRHHQTVHHSCRVTAFQGVRERVLMHAKGAVGLLDALCRHLVIPLMAELCQVQRDPLCTFTLSLMG